MDKAKLLPILNFFRVTDEFGVISLTQLLIWVMIVKIALSPTLDLSDAAALFTAVGAYHFKGYLKHDRKNREDAKGEKLGSEDVAALKADISKLKLHAGLKGLNENLNNS